MKPHHQFLKQLRHDDIVAAIKSAEAKTSGKAKIDSLKAKAPAKAPKVAKASKVVAPKVSAPVVAPKTSAKAPKVPGSR